MLKLLGLIISSAGTVLFMSGCMSCSQYLQNTRYIMPETGEQPFCTHHRVPLLTVTGFIEPRFAHVDGFQRNEMTREAFRQYEGTVFACNPNCVQPHYSLQRHGRFTAPASITYCFKCEQAVAPYRNAPRLNFEVQHLLGLKEALIGCFVAMSFSWSVVEVFGN
jgi:hypothetical protein